MLQHKINGIQRQFARRVERQHLDPSAAVRLQLRMVNVLTVYHSQVGLLRFAIDL